MTDAPERPRRLRAPCTQRPDRGLLDAGVEDRGASARDLVDALQADVDAFADGAEAHDDLAILALRWNGLAPPSAATPGGPE